MLLRYDTTGRRGRDMEASQTALVVLFGMVTPLLV